MMGVSGRNIVTSLRSLTARIFHVQHQPSATKAQNKFGHYRPSHLSAEKREKINRLCEQLLTKQELITSGKLQFIGLTKIRKRLGKRWGELSRLIYETAEDVIALYLNEKTDFYIRYKDEAYFILFTRATSEEGRAQASRIADEIRRRLFALGEKELRDLEIRESVSVISRNHLEDFAFYDFLDAFASNEHFTAETLVTKPEKKKAKAKPVKPDYIEVEPEDYEPPHPAFTLDAARLNTIHYTYLPLWDVQRNALTTYLCMARDTYEYNNVFDAHKALYTHSSAPEHVAMDMQVLRVVIEELNHMLADGRKLLIACPVQYDTLHHFPSYEDYKALLQEIPPEARKLLILYVMDIENKLPVDDAYWFIQPLQEYCCHFFAEVPLRPDINFHYLHNLGVSAVGFRLEGMDAASRNVVRMIKQFSFRAKAFKIPMTFVFELSRLNFKSSAILTEYDYLGGPAIHKEIQRPDRIHKFDSADLLIKLGRKNAS